MKREQQLISKTNSRCEVIKNVGILMNFEVPRRREQEDGEPAADFVVPFGLVRRRQLILTRLTYYSLEKIVITSTCFLYFLYSIRQSYCQLFTSYI